VSDQDKPLTPDAARRLAVAAARSTYGRPDDYPCDVGVCLVPNTPGVTLLWSKRPSQLRPMEKEEMRERLKAAGIEELACADYPAEGDDAGHTWAMVLRAGEAEHERLWQLVRDFLAWGVARLQAMMDSYPKGIG
jgi:hypothetical protein